MSIIYNHSVLPNGITLVSEKIPHVRSVAVGLWIARGSRDERSSENGLSHLIEHLLFKGTKTRTARDIAIFLESIGGHLDAFTSKEETCFYARVLDEHLPQAVDILSDIISHPRFDPQDLEKERKVILEEIKTIEDTPDEVVHELFSEALFDGHPLSYPILGSRENCQSFKMADIQAFRRKNYLPGNMVLAVAGRVEHQTLEQLAQRYLGQYQTSAPAKKNADADIKAPGLLLKRKKTSQVHICLGMPALAFSDPGRYALLVLNTIFGGGMSSRLFQKIREEEGLAYSIYSFADLYRDTGLFGVYLGVAVEQTRRSLETTLAEFKRLLVEPPSPEELENAKSQLKGNLMLGLESTSNRMMRLAKMEINREPYLDLGQTLARIDAVTTDDLLAIAQRVIRPEALAAAVLGPVSAREISLPQLRELLQGS
ncbi:MAG: insulinase family protein [Candidatus Edwardsbacteria bacterium]|nr:insulinase family protein [Candidatus Edwardsbacteria bacterium]MBU1576836.1 insulinase family protein [Candidatus Edwardsbacteria bacterium]MBU2463823.1 insulinase family protein [Candidatus Edwardsbacteria bacterium]MBU2593395.1 insulinase family protein [Candidatus Edwardsbacteria bacterium]